MPARRTTPCHREPYLAKPCERIVLAMAFAFNLNLSVSYGDKLSHKGELPMGDWADSAFRRLRSKEGSAHDENQQRAMNRHQIMANAPYLWEKLVKTIQEEIGDFNDQRPDYLGFAEWTFQEGPALGL